MTVLAAGDRKNSMRYSGRMMRRIRQEQGMGKDMPCFFCVCQRKCKKYLTFNVKQTILKM